jgi:fumarate hydratase class II
MMAGEIILCQSRHTGPTCLESDSMGRMEVPTNGYWGAQTARSLSHVSIGHGRMQGAAFYDR